MLRFATRLTLVPVLVPQPIRLISRRALARCAALLLSGTLAVGLFAAAAASDLSAAVYTYTPMNSTTDLWSAGSDWSAAPASGTATELTFVDATGSTAVANSLANTNTDDISGLFQLNILDLGGSGPASGAATININSTSPSTGLDFVTNGSTAPVVNLTALSGAAGLTYTINAPITLAANTTFQGNGTATFNVAGAISGSGFSVTKSGSSTLTLSGANTYTGGTTINGGTLIFQNNNSGSSNFVDNATLQFVNTNALSNGTNIQLSGGTISGTGNLIKSGTGRMLLGNSGAPQTIALTGANSVIDVQAGVLRNEFGNSAWTGNKAALEVDSGAFFDTWDGNTTVDYLTGSGTINKGWSNNNTLTIGVNNGSGTFSGAITNNVTTNGYGGNSGGNFSLVKNGAGSQTLSGACTYAGGTTINGGTLLLDMSTGSLANAGALTLGGGTLRLQGKSGASTSQTVASLTLTAGTGSSIVIAPNGGTSTTLTISGTAASTVGAVNFNYSAGTTNGATVGNDIVVWSPSLTNGVIGGGYTVTDVGGVGFATVSSGNVIRLTDPGSAGLPLSGGASGTNYFVNSNYSTSVTTTPGSLVEALSGGVAANTVTVDTTGLTSGANLVLGATTLTLTSGGGMVFSGANPYTITATAGGGITTSAAGGSTTFANYSSSTVTISAPILNNSANTVAFVGSGTTILTGANTYTGATTVGGGATLEFNYSGAVTYAGSITGALGGTLVKAGSGTLSLTNSSSSFAGQININSNGSTSGALAVGQNNGGAGGDNITYSGSNTNPLGTGAINVAAGAALQLNAGGLTVSNNITLNGTTYGTDPDTGQAPNNSGVWNGAIMGDALGGVNTNTLTGTLTLAATSNISTNWSDKTLSITGQITGPGGLIIDNSAPGNRQGGVFKLSNSSNNYQGGTTIVGSGGNGNPAPILLAGAANVIPGGASAGNVIDNGTLNMAGFSQSINGLSGGGTIDGAGGTPTLTIGNNNGAGTFTGVIENSSGTLALTKVGTGIISLTAANTYSGTTTISGGTLSVGTFTTNNASGGTSTSLGTGPVSVAAGATLAFSNTGLNIANNITLNGMTPNGALVGGVANNPQANTLSGTLTLAATSNLTTVWNDKTLTITGQVTGPGGLTIDAYTGSNNQGGIIVLSNTTNPANNYAGDTTIDAGTSGSQNPTLRMGAANQIPSGTTAGNVNVNGILSLNSFSQLINGLSGAGTVDGISGTPTLTVGNNNATSSFSGVIQNSSGALALTKVGSGILTLTNSQTYSGPTIVSSGTLRLSNFGSTNSIANSPSITIASGATLDVTGLSGGTLAMTGTQSFIGSGAGTNTVNGNISTVSGTTITPGSKTAIGATNIGGLSLASGANLNYVFGTPGASPSAPGLGSLINVAGTLTLPASGLSLNLIDNNNANTQGVLGNGYYELFTYGTLSGNPTSAFNTAPGKTYTFSTQTVGSVNELLVQIQVQQSVWTGQTNSAWDSGVNATTNWANNTSGNNCVAGQYTDGSIAVFQDTNPITSATVGNTNVQIQSGGVTPQSVVFNNNAVTYTLSNTGANGIGGAGSTLVVNGPGTVILNGANSYGAGTTIAGGTVRLGNSNALGAVTGLVTLNGGTLDLATDASVSPYNVSVGGTARIVSDKATSGSAGITHTLGTLAIGGDQLNVGGGANVISGTAGLTFGAVTLSGPPTFNVTNPTAGGTTRLSLGAVNNGANTMTFIGNGNVVQTGVWGNGAGGVTIGPAFTGTMTLNQANAYTGVTTLDSGTLVVANASGMGAASDGVTVNGGTLDLASDTAVSGYNVTMNTTNAVYADKATAASAGITHALGTLALGAGIAQFNVAGGANVSSGVAGLSFTGVTIVGPTKFSVSNPVAGGTTLLSLGAMTSGANNLTFTGNGNVVQTGAWGGGAGSLTLDSNFTGIATLSQANTYGGGTAINNGTLIAQNNSALGQAGTSVTIAAGATLDVGGSNLTGYNVSVAGAGVGGAGAIVNSGAAQTSALSGLTLTGDTTIGGGPGSGEGGADRWDIRSDTATVNGEGLNLTKTGSNYIAIATSTVNGSATVTNVKNINVNSGVLALENNVTVDNSTPGSIFLNTGGTLSIGNWGSTPGVVINKPIVMAGGTLSTDNNSGNGTAAIPSGTPITLNSTGNFIAQAGSTLTLNDVISDGTSMNNGIAVSGGGAVSLINSNTYTGTTNVLSGGILSVGAYTSGAGAPGSSAGLGGSSVNVAAGGELVFASTGLNIANNVTLNGTTTDGALVGGLQTNPVNNTYSGTLTLAATSNVTTFWSDKILDITGQVTGPGGLIVDNYSTGTQPGGVIVLSNPTNNYQGDTTINANKNGFANPILQAGAAGVVPSTGNLNVNGQLDLNHFSQSVGALNGIGVVDSSTAGTPTLTIGSNNASGNFAGVIQNSSGTVSLTKAGSGVQVLSNANTYSGATNITGGTLRLGVQLPSSLPIANLQTWFDATDSQTLTVSGGKVTSVANRAGVDSATQANSANQPTLNASNAAFNGLPTLTFSGNQHLNGFNTSYLNSSSYTIFTVSAVDAGGNQYLLGSNSGGTNTSLHFGYRDSTTFTLAQFNNDLNYSPTTPAQSYNGSSEVAMDWSGKLDTASGHAIYFNGGSSVASSGNTDALISQTTTSGILGAGFNNSAPFNGDVGEVLIFNTALSDAQRAAVDAYLQTKWGISGASSWASTVLPSGTPVTISNGGILNLNGGNQTIGSLASSDATTQAQLGAGTLTTGNDGTSTLFAGSIIGSGGLTKINGGTLTLSNGASNYSGPTNVNGGTLRVTNASGSATGSGTVTINGATLASGTAGTISGPVVAGTGAVAIAPGGIGTVGTLNLGSTLSLTGASTLDFDVIGAMKDLLAVSPSNPLTISGTPNVVISTSGTLSGNYTLATFGNTPGLSLTNFNVSGVPAGYALQVEPTDLMLIATNASAQWNVNISGNSNGAFSIAGNWSPGAQPSGIGLTATFGNGDGSPTVVNAASATVTVDGAFTDGTLAFTNTNGTAYTLAGDGNNTHGITLDNGASAAVVSVASGVTAQQVISTNLTFNDNVTFNVAPNTSLLISSASISETNGSRNLLLTGGGTLAFNATPVNYSGTTTISGGTLRVSATSNISSNAVLLDATGGNVSTLQIANLQTVSNLTTSNDANGGSATLEVQSGGSMTVSPTGAGTSTFQGKVQLDSVGGVGATLAKAGVSGSMLVLNGPTNFQTNSSLQVNDGTLRVSATGTPSVGTGVTATVASGAMLELAGSVSALADPTATNPPHRVDVANAGILQIDAGAMQQVGGIDPSSSVSGSVTILAGGNLTANHINQSSLVIGSGSTFTIAASAPDGSPMASQGSGSSLVLAGSLTPSNSFVAASGSLLGVGSTGSAVSPSLGSGRGSGATAAVPEPSTMVLAVVAGLAGLVAGLRRRRVD